MGGRDPAGHNSIAILGTPGRRGALTLQEARPLDGFTEHCTKAMHDCAWLVNRAFPVFPKVLAESTTRLACSPCSARESTSFACELTSCRENRPRSGQ
eukprot:4977844-Pyramimonas_sp.AAC.1